MAGLLHFHEASLLDHILVSRNADDPIIFVHDLDLNRLIHVLIWILRLLFHRNIAKIGLFYQPRDDGVAHGLLGLLYLLEKAKRVLMILDCGILLLFDKTQGFGRLSLLRG